MADSMSYPTNTYIATQSQYYSAPHLSHGHVHVVSPPPRPEATQRKRPKYTRSKTGCLTCRVKKIKCDETKPNCMRCTHGQRDCTWPEGVPTRKKSAPKKEGGDVRPSTAGSSGLSEASSPPTREATPPKRPPVELGLPPLVSRRQSDPYLQLNPMTSESEAIRCQSDRCGSAPIYPQHSTRSSNSMLTMIPEMSPYPTPPRYDHPYPNGVDSMSPSTRHSVPTGMRGMVHPSVNQWTPPTMMPPVNPIQSYYHSAHDRSLVGHTTPSEHTRYQ